MKKLLITSGFPRSGNTYLNQAMNLLYYPNEKVNQNFHTIKAIKEAQQIFVPFRNPFESIASWHNYPGSGKLEEDVKFYIRFYSFVLDNLKKIILMDFFYFTQDVEYVKTRVMQNLGIKTPIFLTNSQIKEKMLSNGKKLNLPRDNQDSILQTKNLLPKVLGFEECLMLYDKIKKISFGENSVTR